MAGITLRLQWQGDGLAQMIMASEQLVGQRKHAALRRAVNHVGDKTFTAVKRTLTKQMGLASQKLFKDGRTITKRRAVGATLEFQIVARGGAVRAKEFRHSVGSKGVTFYPWGRRLSIKSGFVIRKYNGNFYRRRTAARVPLEALYGPNLSKEMVKDATAAAFLRIASTDLPARIAHEVRVITNGIVS